MEAEDQTDILDEVATVIDGHSETMKLQRYLRRIGRALGQLGILGVVGADWARIDPVDGTISFAPISRERLHLFAFELEAQVEHLVQAGVRPSPFQLRLDLDLSPLVFVPAVRPHLGGTA